MNDFTLIINNLFRKKLRAILLLFSIAAAFLIFGALGAFYKTWNAGVEFAAADRLMTVNKINFTVSLPTAHVHKIRAIEGVKNAAGGTWFGGYYQDARNQVQTFAIDAEPYLAAYPELVMPEEQRQAFYNTRDCLLAGADTATALGWKLGDTVPLRSNIYQQTNGSDAWEFTICAIFDGDAEGVPANYVVFHFDYLNEATAFGRDGVNWFVVNTDDPALNDVVSNRIDALFANSRAETETSTEAAFNAAFQNQFGNITMILSLVIGAAFVTILMIVGTTMIMAVTERTKEIAVMKTLGFQSGRIFSMILAESVLLTLLGGLIGLAIAWGLIKFVLGPVLVGFLPGLGVSPEVFMVGVPMMVGLGLITGAIPAIKAMRTNIVSALGKG